MGIEQAFGFGNGPAEVVFVGQKADYAPYEERIAYLEGQLRGTVRGYEKGIAELTAVAKRSKFLAEKNAVLVELFKDTLREFVAQGRMTREEVNTRRKKLEKLLPQEEIETLLQFRAQLG